MKHWICTALVAASVMATATLALAQDAKKADMTAEQAMMAAAMVGEQHKMMEKMTGDWGYTMKVWTAPGTEPMETSGKRSARMVMGGRYLVEDYTGDFQGMPFEGQGMLGYDNTGKQYVGTWIDNMSTGIMNSHGTCDNGVWKMTGESLDPVTGKPVTSRSTVTMKDADTMYMEMWMPGPDGKDMKWMEMTCKRTK